METLENIQLLQKRLLFLNNILAGFLYVGDSIEIDRVTLEINAIQSELDALNLKIEEDANRESELPVD